MKNYPYDTERRLREAKMIITRLENPKDPSDVYQAVLAFIEQACLSLFPLRKLGAHKIDGFDAWWLKIGDQLKNDPICQYFANLRNEMAKGGKDLVCINFIIEGPFIMSGPMQIGSDGVLKGIKDERGVPRWQTVQDVKGLRVTEWGFRNHPSNLSRFSAPALCHEYIFKLDEIVSDYINQFS